MRVANRHTCVLLGVFFTLFSFIPVSNAQDYSTGLVGHWKMDDTTGTTAFDSSGNGNNGTMSGGLDAGDDSVTGAVDTALNLDGDNVTKIDVYGSELDNLDPLTVCLWFNVDTWTNSDSDTLFGLSQKAWGLRIDDVNTTPKLTFWISGVSGSYPSVDASISLSLGQWYHVCAAHYGDFTSPDIYVDGEYKSTAKVTGTGVKVDDTGSLLRFGASSGSSYSRNFPGSIDDARVYNRALSLDDVRALYHGAAPGTLHYNDDAESLEYHDGASWVHAGLGSYSPNAVNFDGTNDYLSITSAPMSDSKSITGSLWTRRETAGTGERIIHADASAWALYGPNGSGAYVLVAENNSGAMAAICYTTSSFDDTDWHHVMFSVDLTDTNKRHMYVDGVDALSSCSTYTDDVMNLDQNLRIGRNNALVYFDGDMADIWLKSGTYIDFSVEANRRKFISENGAPMMLGENGSLPTGQAPDIFLSGDTEDWHKNKGTGGDFTETGEITDAATNAGKHLLKWEQVGNGVAMAGHTTSAIAKLTQSTIAYADSNNSTLTTYSWDGIDWTQVGNDLSVGIGPQTRLTPLNNNTVVEVSGDNGATADNLTTYSWDGTDWTQVGNIFTLPVSSHHAITTLDNTTIAYIGSNDEDITTYSWDGTDWSQVGNVLSATSIYRPDIDALDSTTIVLNDTGSGGLRTYSWDGTNWSQVGNSFAVANSPEKPAITAINSTTIAMVQDEIMQTYSWDGTDWTAFGQPYTITGAGNTPAIELFSGNTVAFTDNTNDTLQTYQFAFCSTPERIKGTMVFNSTFNLMQYCNGVDWVAMGGLGGTGSGCSDPSGDAGDMIYNGDYNIMQYCNSEDWRGVGKNIYSMLDYGLVGHWKLDETTGTTAVDSSDSGFDGTYSSVDPVTNSVEGIDGNAIDLDGTTFDNVAIGDVLDLDGSALSISAWIKTDTTFDNDSIVDRLDGNEGYRFTVNNSGSLEFGVRDSGGTYEGVGTPNNVIANGQWAHVVATFDNDTTGYIYVNGSRVGSKTNFTTKHAAGTEILAIGRSNNNSQWFDGAIDDVRIWDRVLSSGEVNALYGLYVAPDITTGLLGHWPLDETSGAVIADISGSGNNGTWTDGTGDDVTEETTVGPVNTAIDFDGTGDIINFGNDSSLNITDNTMTISGWLQKSVNAETGTMFYRGIDGSNGYQFSIGMSGCSSTQITFSKFSRLHACLDGVPVDTAWHHYIVVADTTGISSYVDGVLTDTNSNTQNIDSSTENASTRSNLNGALDDLRIYDRALSAADIALLYSTGQSNLTEGLVGHWKLDETTGTTAIDSSGNGNDGSMTGGLDAGSNSTTGALAGALSFDGSNDITQLPNLLVSEDPEPISVCAWFNADSLHNGTIWNYAAQGFTNFDRVITLGVKSSGVAFSGKEDQDAESSSTYSVGTWNHVCGIFTNGGNRTIYFNGVFEGTDTSWRGSNNLDRMAIGARWGTTSDRFFDGDIDDVRVYNRALSASDVQALYDDPCDNAPDIGDVCRDGSYYAGLTPDGSVPMYMADATSQVAGTAWSSAYSVTGFTSLTDGDGNTAGLVALGDAGAPYPAAVYCDALDAHGHQDWYLPARDEMDLIYNGGVQIGNVETAGIAYWSSTESSVTHSWQTYFGSGVQNDWSSKLNGKYVRCVRQN